MMLKRLRYLLRITHSYAIARRYFVTNGFDGALTMLGLNTGFYISNHINVDIAFTVSIGTAIALAMSGITSAYISESAEKQKELSELERAMIQDLDDSEHGLAARMVPFVIAMVNGLSPLLLSLIIISPLWLTMAGFTFPIEPSLATLIIAFTVIFLMGLYLGYISKKNWLWTGIRAVLIAVVTTGIILLIDQKLK